MEAQQTLAQRVAARANRPGIAQPKQRASAQSTLDTAHTALLRALLGRGHWSRAELHREAKLLGLMPFAALERINEWALLHHGDLLAEGEATITINQQIGTAI